MKRACLRAGHLTNSCLLIGSFGRKSYTALCCLLCALFFADLFASEVDLLPLTVDLHDTAALQRGAKVFMNYCSGCHSLRYMRYNRMAKDLELMTFSGAIDTHLLVSNLIFTKATVYEPIVNSMPETDARQWFGRVPPDLSLAARERGSAWIYTYLKSFYLDTTRPFGANNLLVPDVSMPNVLAPLEGTVIAVHQKTHEDHPLSLVLIEQGEMSPQQFNRTLQDLVTFLTYVAEPVQLIRYRMGLIVILFLFVFFMVAYQLKTMYWRNLPSSGSKQTKD
jgi:ubiquinol-cytochrome c reductase cytochrome c1 subunit